MQTELEDLKEANLFLNLLLDNINSAVLIADENFNLFRINHSFLKIFEEPSDSIAGKTLGKAMGCIHTFRENKPCGETSYCDTCPIRDILRTTMSTHVPVDRKRVEKMFFVDGHPQKKILEVTSRYIRYHQRRMILLILYDVTDLEMQRIELEKRQIQIEHDLEAAAGIQQSLLPAELPDIERVEIAWKFEPSSEIGGDIFNIQRLDKDHIGLYVLDVCGHGVSAAFFSVAVSQFLQSRSCFLVDKAGIVSPGEVLNSLNQRFPFERFDSYFTIVYMLLDLPTGRVTYGSAGHPAPVVIRSGKDLEVLQVRGPIIGLSDATQYREGRFRLRPGDQMLLYTDGALDIRDPHGEFFGRNRLLEILKGHAGEPIQALIATVSRRLQDFGLTRAPEDDITLVGVAYTG